MFADPLVAENKGILVDYIVPLDLEFEYANIVNNLRLTGKHFKLHRQALTRSSLSELITQNPKILHISCHGSFTEVDGKK